MSEEFVQWLKESLNDERSDHAETRRKFEEVNTDYRYALVLNAIAWTALLCVLGLIAF